MMTDSMPIPLRSTKQVIVDALKEFDYVNTRFPTCHYIAWGHRLNDRWAASEGEDGTGRAQISCASETLVHKRGYIQLTV